MDIKNKNNVPLELVKVLHIKSQNLRAQPRLTADPVRINHWLKLIRITAWTIRIVNNLFRKTGPLTRDEIIAAEHELYKEAQQDFREEREGLFKRTKTPKSSEP